MDLWGGGGGGGGGGRGYAEVGGELMCVGEGGHRESGDTTCVCVREKAWCPSKTPECVTKEEDEASVEGNCL